MIRNRSNWKVSELKLFLALSDSDIFSLEFVSVKNLNVLQFESVRIKKKVSKFENVRKVVAGSYLY